MDQRTGIKNNSKILKTMGLVLVFLVLLDCSTDIKSVKKKFPGGERFISKHSIEKAGFQHIDSENFGMLITGKYAYLLNRKDKMVTKTIKYILITTI